MRYELYYHASNPGRGEFVRLALEEAGAEYVEVAREPGGTEAMTRFMQDASNARAPFAPPFLRHGDVIVGQTANILHYLGPKLGLAPDDEAGRLWAHTLQLTIADLVKEIQDTHHPIAHGLYYDDQKREAIEYSKHFIAERLPKFLGYFERVLEANGGERMAGERLSYVDLSMFQLVEGLRFSFPKAMARAETRYPAIKALHDRVAERPKIAAYLASPRRMAFNDRGVFRQYPELDAS
jgi:glutathione S-transferase